MQCKQLKAFNVGVSTVRELYEVMATHGAPHGFVVTSGQVTQKAAAFCQRTQYPVDGWAGADAVAARLAQGRYGAFNLGLQPGRAASTRSLRHRPKQRRRLCGRIPRQSPIQAAPCAENPWRGELQARRRTRQGFLGLFE